MCWTILGPKGKLHRADASSVNIHRVSEKSIGIIFVPAIGTDSPPAG